MHQMWSTTFGARNLPARFGGRGEAFPSSLPLSGVVDNDEPPFPPADCTSWNEPERDAHATFPVYSWCAKCIPMVTNSLSFANSEFTFSNNLRLNNSFPLKAEHS
jgi:hypothetical protein